MQHRNVKNNGLKIFLLLLFIPAFGLAQMPNTLFFMRGTPQRYQINPAFQPECNFFIGLPGVSPAQLKIQNSPFALKDVVYYDDEIDSLITFLHPRGDKEAFLALLKETNFINTEVSVSLGSFGFRSKNLFFTFDISERLFAQVSYPDDYIRLPIIGPDEGTTYDFNNFAVDLTALNELSMGVSTKLGDRLTIGVRGKLLFGQANFNTELFDVTFSASETEWPLHTDISFNSSSPYLTDYVELIANAPLDLVFGGLDDMDIEEPTIKEIRKMALNTKNLGLGLDIGADYRINEWLQVSASVVDIGRIKWNNGVLNLKNSADYYFNGVDYILDDDEDFFDDFTDSIENTFDNFTSTETSYGTWLPAKVYAGAAFNVHPKISFGLLSRTDFYQGNIREQFTVSANLYPTQILSTTFSYSIIDNYYKNIGFGLALKAFPFNLYIITDTGPSVAMWYNEAKYVNLRIGMNLIFGCKKEKSKKKAAKFDLPVVD
jgi:hypothetical protein